MFSFISNVFSSKSDVSSKIFFGFIMISVGIVGHFFNLHAHTNIILITMGSLNLGLTVIDRSDVL